VVGDVHPVAARRGHRGGDAEVGDHRLALLEQDVLRLDVAVDDAETVGVAEGGRHRAGDAEGNVHRQRPLAAEAVAQALASRVGHDEVQQPRVAGPGGLDLAGIVQRENLRVGEPGGDPDLAEKALRLVAGDRPQHLDGDFAAVLQVLGQVHGRRTPAADLFLEAVPVGDGAAGGQG
jgi:hypothetical protein